MLFKSLLAICLMVPVSQAQKIGMSEGRHYYYLVCLTVAENNETRPGDGIKNLRLQRHHLLRNAFWGNRDAMEFLFLRGLRTRDKYG
jgi:hypothetical protein